ncbi:PREDICTED: putative F-box protein At4g22660 [Fragaria vesca subsp. vesca]|uniref:putative F-box protein At4g22660 n=1 Tax=Fragaria vesca subsp. vesca TaxID=101020 RepID=UPI0002C30411|nr:PREDICTED: putative F-box protein At4g22660 [Fragaria vesca subsp. vesca]
MFSSYDDDMRRKRGPIRSRWSDLPPELLELIMKKLASVDILRFEAVCSRWCKTAKSYISSPYFTLDMPQTPWLMIPGGEGNHIHTRRFFNLSEFKYYTIKNTFGYMPDACCIGSSHGWLVLTDEKARPARLLNPFSGDRIDLPSIGWRSTIFLGMSRDDVVKVVTSSKPPSEEDFGVVVVVVILNSTTIGLSQLACYRHGHDEGWTNISTVVSYAYHDGIFHSTNGNLYALATDGSVEVWDMRQCSPITTLHLQPLSHQLDIDLKLLIPCTDSMFYLVESLGELLLVRRFIRKTTDHPGYPYRTVHFSIYRLKSISKGFEWEKVESLHNQSLFLGGNHSISLSCHSLPECEENSIYFTDDRWWEMNKNGKYGVGNIGGHDLGVYNIKDDIVKPMPCYMRFDRSSINPPPFWIVPDIIHGSYSLRNEIIQFTRCASLGKRDYWRNC